MQITNMQITNKKQMLSVLLTVVISVFAIALVVYGATTIGANVTTGSATTTDSLYIGGTAFITGVASSSAGFRLNDNFVIDASGIASTTQDFSVGDGNSTATSTIEIGDTDTAGCLKIRDADADAWTYCYTSDGSMICDTTDNCDK